MLDRSTLKAKRKAAGIPGRILCRKVGIAPSRFSELESGYITPRSEELHRINLALDELIAIKHRMDQFAKEAGWPVEAFG